MTSTTNTELVACQAVVARRGSFTLEVPTWKVEAGCVVGIIGANGAGKTTLLELLPGLRRPDSGSVRVFDQDPVQRPRLVRSKLGFMSADTPVFDLRVGRLLNLLSGYYATWDADYVEGLVARFSLDVKRKASELSRGQATRLRLVTALAFRPQLLVLDEPTAGLDLEGRHALMETILEVVRNQDRSVVVSSHQLQDVARLADRLLVLQDGRVVQDGPTDSLVGETQTLEEAVQAWEAKTPGVPAQ